MPIQTVICPECKTTITADIPLGYRARLDHRPGTDILRMVPQVKPIHTGILPGQPVNPLDKLSQRR